MRYKQERKKLFDILEQEPALKKPYKMTVESKVLYVSSWTDVLLCLVTYYVEQDRENIEVINSLRKRTKTKLISSNSDATENHKLVRIAVAGEAQTVKNAYIAVYRIKNTKELLSMCKRICVYFGSEKDVEVFLCWPGYWCF